ncbi:AbiU2 domain-containing protein [Acetobacter oeni]|uniref:HEPN AbiU2-like domain-containing protein n=1 Tax=Acetobacter oeni TaxID=304077 RepID=A0A511XQW7_9PROT|nr:hypothetical protein [Acetobacter oeni]MBB3884938.1 hypothetical protein [Acetobacter oeni]NHO20821.1 hypothetical protein [Acetobacter oeni]GBR06334.1 hypothetical protein AA21952_1990 [Acetobacter oeni LMG 21952]GEN65361.1 hypothetical protein AOE01nite_35850 [Acetobacter oeni]
MRAGELPECGVAYRVPSFVPVSTGWPVFLDGVTDPKITTLVRTEERAACETMTALHQFDLLVALAPRSQYWPHACPGDLWGGIETVRQTLRRMLVISLTGLFEPKLKSGGGSLHQVMYLAGKPQISDLLLKRHQVFGDEHLAQVERARESLSDWVERLEQSPFAESFRGLRKIRDKQVAHFDADADAADAVQLHDDLTMLMETALSIVTSAHVWVLQKRLDFGEIRRRSRAQASTVAAAVTGHVTAPAQDAVS